KAGMLLVLQPLGACLTLPIMLLLVIPIFHRLDIYSIYEYLEMRFSLAVRMAGSGLFVLWRLLWMGGVLYAPCKVLAVATGLHSQVPLLIIILGAVGTAYTFLGGMKAVIWTDVVQAFVMYSGLILIVLGVWYAIDGGAGEVWRIATQFNRTDLVQFSPAPKETFWSDRYLIWGFLPHMLI